MNRVLFGDCRDTMRDLKAQGVRVQCCVTSPPYYGLRDYGHPGQLGLEATPAEFLRNMVEVFDCVRDLLADDGVLWVNMGDSYANDGKYGGETGGKAAYLDEGSRTRAGREKRVTGLKPKDLMGIPWRVAFALQEAGWYLRQDIIWHKPNPMPESIKDRCTKAHEYIFLLSKSERYFYDADAISEEAQQHAGRAATCDRSGNAVAQHVLPGQAAAQHRPRQRKPAGWDTGAGGHGSFHRDGRALELEYTEVGSERRNKRSVWTIATEPYPEAHFATFPRALIEPCILAGSRPGDVVLDPFMGSGTTAEVAQALGRNWLGCEINPEYAPLQQARTAQTALAV